MRWLVEGVEVDEERGLFFAAGGGRSGVGRVNELEEECAGEVAADRRLLVGPGGRGGEETDLKGEEKDLKIERKKEC